MIELTRYLQRLKFPVLLVPGYFQALVRKLGELRFNLPRHQGIGTEWPLEFSSNPEGCRSFVERPARCVIPVRSMPENRSLFYDSLASL